MKVEEACSRKSWGSLTKQTYKPDLKTKNATSFHSHNSNTVEIIVIEKWHININKTINSQAHTDENMHEDSSFNVFGGQDKRQLTGEMVS